ncbi:hypothetical protein BB559_005814 [Furculomyces boomerangus]|uniref:Distal membrane-arm assembly complex protein 1-like domain-containing protein n=2 Tax=Harpellales TaxID=61421 RepID=A0A2T9Y6F1_9FUNG|nr:hypothetical protein BB559_005814 [Furculomyces boomerangus]PVZ97922.1 hypothetical protein BB558_006107 [Smittium angustum]
MASNDQEKEYEDCLGCRIVGSSAFVGLGGYALYQRQLLLKSGQKGKKGLLFLGAGFISAGLYRLFAK